MKLKILLSSTSFIDTPGFHHDLLNDLNYDIDTHRGPLKESYLIEIIEKYDALICGDDELTSEVLRKGSKSKLKYISKYGTGLDKIDLNAVDKYKIKLKNCPGINQSTVAEHVFALLLSFKKNIFQEIGFIKQNKWNRLTGTELKGKYIGIIGVGNIGKEVIKRAIAFEMNVIAYDKCKDLKFAKKYDFKYEENFEELLKNSDIISLHLNLSNSTYNILDKKSLSKVKSDVIIVNTARADLINLNDIVKKLEEKKIGGYLTDVLEEEPMIKDHPLLKFENVIITPHIGSRTYENVVKQGTKAVKNLIEMVNN